MVKPKLSTARIIATGPDIDPMFSTEGEETASPLPSPPPPRPAAPQERHETTAISVTREKRLAPLTHGVTLVRKLTVDMDSDFHCQIKAAAAESRQTLQALVSLLLDAWLIEHRASRHQVRENAMMALARKIRGQAQ